jgi:4-amino-4-deoxy-L-arabinose transferase-like glycosyltransferase
MGSGFHFADEAIYVDTARRLSQGGGFGADYRQVPGYPVFLMLLSLGLPGQLPWLRATQAVVAALGTLLVVRLADRMFGRPTAIAAGLVYALDPLLVIASGLLYPEATAAVLLPAIILSATAAAERDAVTRSALTGGLLGLLTLLRPVALVLPPVLGGWIALTTATRPARRAAHLGALGLTFLLVLAPWTARNYRIHGQLVPLAAAGAHTAPVTKEQVAEQGFVVSMTRWAWRDPASVLSRVTRQFAQFWELVPTRMTTDDPVKRERLHQHDSRLPVQPLFSRRLRDLVSAGSFSLELFLALVGVIVVSRPRWRQALLLVAVIFTYAVGYALFVAKVRYRIPVLPLLFLFTGAGAAAVYRLIRRAADRRLSSSPSP